MTFVFLALIYISVIGCPPRWSPTHPDIVDWYVLMPVKADSGRSMPAVVLGYAYYNTPEVLLSGAAVSHFSAVAGNMYKTTGKVRYDAGYFRLPQVPNGSYNIDVTRDIDNLMYSQNVQVSKLAKRVLSGELSSEHDLTWDSSEVIEVTRSISVPAGRELRIKSGVIVFVQAGVNIEIMGSIVIEGRRRQPVVFLSEDPLGAWGGIYLDGGSADITDCLITEGGGDDSRVFGHSQSQPVIGGKNALLTARRLAVVNNKGKAFGFENSEITLEKSLIQRCDTGGEFAGCKVTIDGCWFLEMPIDDAIAVDGDNDALYMRGANGVDTSFIRNSYFVKGKDDAIDHNGALLVVSNCLIDGFDNEGLAGSSELYVRIENCYIMNCEQGIEAGYGAPFVDVNHCTIRHCDTGLRFGDWYNWGCNGKLTARNTISIDNRLHNVFNFDVLSDGEIPGAIEISYSLVNDPAYNSGIGCITGTPVINDFGVLSKKPRQPGWQAGSDSLDMGRLERWSLQ